MMMTLLSAVLLSATEVKRVAVVVGSNEAPAGRMKLRFAHTDAEQIAEVLRGVGNFSEVILLRDPEPKKLLEALDRAAVRAQPDGGESMFLFYYSGHADPGALYPQGQALAMSEVKQRLEKSRATVRIGVLDACRGGGWTGAKALVPDAPFEIPVALGLRSQGSVFIASSSGLEDAHESEALGGSFFTHYLVAGMRGAADASGDRAVTLGEAYRYAQALTVRDTAIAASQPQHPSYEMHLQGRDDLTISEIKDAPSSMELEQERGPIEVIHLGTGVIVLELPAGARNVRAALPPGRYLVRMRTSFGTLARSVELTPGVSVLVRETDLKLNTARALAQKSLDPLPSSAPTAKLDFPAAVAPPPKPKTPVGRIGAISFAWGVSDGAEILGQMDRGLQIHTPSMAIPLNFALSARFRPTERLTLAVGTLAAAYRFGDEGATEVSLAGGAWSFGFGSPSRFIADRNAQMFMSTGVSGDLRAWLNGGTRMAVIAGSGIQNIASVFTFGQPTAFEGVTPRMRGSDTWQIGAYGGMHFRFKSVELTLALLTRLTPLFEGRGPQNGTELDWAIGIGGAPFGLANQPLLRFQLAERLRLDLNSEIVLRAPSSATTLDIIGVRAMAGLTVIL